MVKPKQPAFPQRGQELYRFLRTLPDSTGGARLEDVIIEVSSGQQRKVTLVGPYFPSIDEARTWVRRVYTDRTVGDWGNWDDHSEGIALNTGDGYPPTEAAFAALCEDWRAATAGESDARAIVAHPSFQRMIGLGPEALPLMLRELRDRPAFWFWGLRAIAGTDVAADVADFEGKRAAWLAWGQSKGLL